MSWINAVLDTCSRIIIIKKYSKNQSRCRVQGAATRPRGTDFSSQRGRAPLESVQFDGNTKLLRSAGLKLALDVFFFYPLGVVFT